MRILELLPRLDEYEEVLQSLEDKRFLLIKQQCHQHKFMINVSTIIFTASNKHVFGASDYLTVAIFIDNSNVPLKNFLESIK